MEALRQKGCEVEAGACEGKEVRRRVNGNGPQPLSALDHSGNDSGNDRERLSLRIKALQEAVEFSALLL